MHFSVMNQATPPSFTSLVKLFGQLLNIFYKITIEIKMTAQANQTEGSPWVSMVDPVDAGAIIALCLEFGVLLVAKRLITQYLKEKAEDRKSLQDHAHQFLLDSVVHMAGLYYAYRFVKETIDFHWGGEAMAVIVSTIGEASMGVCCLALLCDLLAQYVLVVKPEVLAQLQISEKALVWRIKIATWILLLLINTLLAAAGDRAIPYYIWTDQPYQSVDGMFVLTHALIGLSYGGAIALRVKVNRHIDIAGEPSHQILSNKAMVTSILMYLPFISVIIWSPDIMTARSYQLLIDFIAAITCTLPLILCILFHPGLRNYAKKKILAIFGWHDQIKTSIQRSFRRLTKLKSPPVYSLNAL